MRLKSCAGASGTPSVDPSHSTSSDTSGPLSPSSITSVRARGAERGAGEVRAHRVARLGDALGDDDALAGGEPVGLHHVEPGQRLEERERLRPPGSRRTTRGARSARRRRRGPPSSTPSSLRAARRGRRPEHRRATGPQVVGEPVDQRRLRADHHEVERVETRDRVARDPGRSRARTIPGLPGAATTESTVGGTRRAPTSSACSRPPDPTTRTFTVTRRGAARRSGRARGLRTRSSRARRCTPR